MALRTRTGQAAQVPAPKPPKRSAAQELEQAMKRMEPFQKAGFAAVARSRAKRRKKA